MYLMQMQMPVAEDLLRNIENFVITIGDVLNASNSEGLNDEDNVTITKKNIGTYVLV